MAKIDVHTDLAVTLDKSLANLLNGEFDLRYEDQHYEGHGLDGQHFHHVIPARQWKLVALANLRALFDATLAAGWNTHTGDWDWQVTFTLADGTEFENTNQPWNFAKAPGEVVPFEEVTACVHVDELEYVAFTAVPVLDGEPDYSGGEIEKFLPVDDIVSIYIEEEH